MAETCKGRKCGEAYQLTENGLKFYKAAQCKKACPPGSTSGLCKACDAAMAGNLATGSKKFHGMVNSAVPNWSHIYDREAGVMSKWGIEKAALELKKTAGETVAIAKSAVASATAAAGPKSAPAKAAKAAVVKAVAAESVAKKAVVSVADFMANVRKEAAAVERKEDAAVSVVKKAASAVVGAENAVVKAVKGATVAIRKTAKRRSSSNRGSMGQAGRRSPNFALSSFGSTRGTGMATSNLSSETKPKRSRRRKYGWNGRITPRSSSVRGVPFRVSVTPQKQTRSSANDSMNSMATPEMWSGRRNTATSGSVGLRRTPLGSSGPTPPAYF